MTTLKELTWDKHKEAEAQPFIKSIFKKQVNVEKYTDYLNQLLAVYQNLEFYAARLDIFEGIEDIRRARLIELDYFELLGPDSKIGSLKQSTRNYISYLDSIQEDKKKLLAHIYVRHMGDMFGGQMLAKLLPGSNRMFQFKDIEKCMMGIRKQLDVSLAPEANIAFDHNINIIKEYND